MALPRPDSQRVQIEDALKHLWECEEGGGAGTVESLAGALAFRSGKAAEVLALLGSQGLAAPAGGVFHLTEDGRQYALRIVRSHRLYETKLAQTTGLPPSDWHRAAHQAEHHLDREEVDRMADDLNNPRFDPHGDPIPTREGTLPARQRVSLAEWSPGQAAVIEHLEDEPESLFRRLGKFGLAPGMLLGDPQRQDDGSIRTRTEGREISIPAVLIPLIHVTMPDPDQAARASWGRLSDLAPGGRTTVRGLSPACIGAERRRLLDLGLVPGTSVTCLFSSPLGSPRSYEIRGTLIALRTEQAARVLVEAPFPVSR